MSVDRPQMSPRMSNVVRNGSQRGDGAPTPRRPQHVGFVHDWLPTYAGAERVLEQMIHEYPEAKLYSLIDTLPDDQRAFLQGLPVTTSFLQRLPFVNRFYRQYLPLAPLAIEQFDLSEHDVVVSSNYAVAKGVLTRADQLHISYVHSPVRYAWDLYHEYLDRSGWNWGLRSVLARMVLHYLRLYDVSTASRVDVYVANSNYVAQRIWKTYRRRAHVIYPPVDVDRFALTHEKEDYYLTLSRLVPYKGVDLIVEAFNELPDKQLIVIGDGPEADALARRAGPNVTLMGYQPEAAVAHYMERARAFVYAAEEDFGIVPVEAQACGTPVIAYGRGGVCETVVPGRTGILYPEQTVSSLSAALLQFEETADQFDPEIIRAQAERFDIPVFREQFSNLVQASYTDFVEGTRPVLSEHSAQSLVPASVS